MQYREKKFFLDLSLLEIYAGKHYIALASLSVTSQECMM